MKDTQTLLIVGPRGTGGIDRYITEQKRHLSGRMNVRLYTKYSSPDDEGLEGGVRMILASLWAILLFPFQSRPDVVHVHTSHTYSFYRSAFFVLFSAYVWRCPVVLHIHGSSFDEFLNTSSPVVKRLQSLVFDTVDDVVVLSQYWRDVVSPLADEEKIHVLANAVEPDEYDPIYDADPVHIVFVSNLIERKGVLELLDAIERLESTSSLEFEVTIAGGGPLADQVEAVARKYDNVEYVGFVSEAEKCELLSSGSIFVLPTHAEGLPIAMLEGMAGGNAIVSTPVGSIPEVITSERGLLVEPGDAAGLTAALEQLVRDRQVSAAMGRENRRLIEDQYSWQANANNLVEMYAKAD